ncbi:glycosyltransferase family 2 protein [Microbulbifer salipaludis]|uniref:Glycosyltransferase family 2 protein n=1 Tax=Microbulbifer salipaludis TaxID=187980 RepID=A0ABS3E2E8_9GAMM|nr:glycosyltransferase family 2 protein [Microbulbifer salipaludis]MBN8429470.1 glycosyltransferase family 2 protein [Microbulbifer salipaludis]
MDFPAFPPEMAAIKKQTMEGRAPLKLAVVIVNYCTPDLVQDCLKSLVPQLSGLNAQAIVVDNASGDHSIELLEHWLKSCPAGFSTKIRLCASSVNGGFSAGNNFGMSQVEAEYYLLLNSDTIVRPGAISLLLSRMEGDRTIGALGPRLEYLDGQQQVSRFRRRGVTSELIRGAQIDLVTKLLKSKNTPIELNEPDQELDWVSFACVLLRSDIVTQIGRMDESFFMYFEDIEYCLRIKRAGYSIKQELDARVVHLRGGTSSVKKNGNARKRVPAYFYQSRSRYFLLLGGRPKLFAANLAWCAGRILRYSKCLLGRAPGPSISGEWRDLWIGFLSGKKGTNKKASPYGNQVAQS